MQHRKRWNLTPWKTTANPDHCNFQFLHVFTVGLHYTSSDEKSLHFGFGANEMKKVLMWGYCSCPWSRTNIYFPDNHYLRLRLWIIDTVNKWVMNQMDFLDGLIYSLLPSQKLSAFECSLLVRSCGHAALHEWCKSAFLPQIRPDLISGHMVISQHIHGALACIAWENYCPALQWKKSVNLSKYIVSLTYKVVNEVTNLSFL